MDSTSFESAETVGDHYDHLTSTTGSIGTKRKDGSAHTSGQCKMHQFGGNRSTGSSGGMDLTHSATTTGGMDSTGGTDSSRGTDLTHSKITTRVTDFSRGTDLTHSVTTTRGMDSTGGTDSSGGTDSTSSTTTTRSTDLTRGTDLMGGMDSTHYVTMSTMRQLMANPVMILECWYPIIVAALTLMPKTQCCRGLDLTMILLEEETTVEFPLQHQNTAAMPPRRLSWMIVAI